MPPLKGGHYSEVGPGGLSRSFHCRAFSTLHQWLLLSGAWGGPAVTHDGLIHVSVAPASCLCSRSPSWLCRVLAFVVEASSRQEAPAQVCENGFQNNPP